MKPFILIGAGGHSLVCLDLLESLYGKELKVLGIADSNPALVGKKVLNYSVMGGDEWVLKHSPQDVSLVNAIGSTGIPELRAKVFQAFVDQGYEFPSLAHPRAIVSRHASLEAGAQVMAGAILQPGVRMGKNSIVNTGAVIDHDGQIGAHVHIAPGCTLSGSVQVGEKSHIGTGASIIQGVSVGKEVLVGAGSLVLKDISDQRKVYGVPVR